MAYGNKRAEELAKLMRREEQELKRRQEENKKALRDGTRKK